MQFSNREKKNFSATNISNYPLSFEAFAIADGNHHASWTTIVKNSFWIDQRTLHRSIAWINRWRWRGRLMKVNQIEHILIPVFEMKLSIPNSLLFSYFPVQNEKFIIRGIQNDYIYSASIRHCLWAWPSILPSPNIISYHSDFPGRTINN